MSGETPNGRTTCLDAVIDEVGCAERLVLVEARWEMALRHPDAIGLVAARHPKSG